MAGQQQSLEGALDGALDGGCACGAVRYRLTAEPLIVHACHCKSCQRQSGSWYAVNALIESTNVEWLQGAIADWDLPTPTGAGQTVTRCVECGVALWSQYHKFSRGMDVVRFVRVGTLDNPGCLSPDVDIHCVERTVRVTDAEDRPRYEEFYLLKEVWSAASLARLRAAFAAHQVTLPSNSCRVSAGSGRRV